MTDLSLRAKQAANNETSNEAIDRRPAREIFPAAYLPLVNRFCASLKASGRLFYLNGEIETQLDAFLAATKPEEKEVKAVRKLFRGCSELLFDGNAAYAMLRPGVGSKRIVCLHPELDHITQISRDDYLELKDAFVQGHEQAVKQGLVLDFAPFFRDFPKVSEPGEMGEGISFLNRWLSAQLYQNPRAFRAALLDFLRGRDVAGISVLVNQHLATPEDIVAELATVRSMLDEHPTDEPYANFAHELRIHGFESGWGRTAGEIKDTLSLLMRVLDSSDPVRLERLLGRLPLIRTVLMVSPHGWFAQDGVLGRPDTGGQVAYVLDQARALEHQMQRQFEECGVDANPRVLILTRQIPNAEGTTCGMSREKILGTDNSWIVRAPFRDDAGEVVTNWVSRFQIWPFLEAFAAESRQLVVNELLGKPDLIIGHYSDGNLVAYRLARDLHVTHCACVHALEKAKYLMSDMHWAELEPDYHFSTQFTADLIAYNSADYIITSSYHEVGGTTTAMGMIESYETFSLPGLYRVRSGLDPRLARHNIVPPGASEEYFFPNYERECRVDAVTHALTERFFGMHATDGCLGELKEPGLPPVFAMARLDKIKNLSGLVELFGKSKSLREQTNLLLVTSINDPALSHDQEEVEEINRIHHLIETYRLEGHFRWAAACLDKLETGEIYRIVADRKGVFAQPALMETFGLTVIEAMACGLPVVATCFGGPAEIVAHDESGTVANPNDHTAFAAALEEIVTDGARWERFAEGGIRRVLDAFTWKEHARKILRMANVHAFWNHIDVMNRQALDRYIHTLYHTVYRPRAQAMTRGG